MLFDPRKQVSQEDRICQERIRQASLSFNLCVAFVGTSAVITQGKRKKKSHIMC
jgi:hypothetical protein